MIKKETMRYCPNCNAGLDHCRKPFPAVFLKRTILFTFVIPVLAATLCQGQGRNLIPSDSVNYILVAGTLVELYGNTTNPALTAESEPGKDTTCPCQAGGENGIVSYTSHSYLVERNECLFLYQRDSTYYARVGRMTGKRDVAGKSTWRFSDREVSKPSAEAFRQAVHAAVAGSEIQRYSSRDAYPVVMDATIYVFGSLQDQRYGVAPVSDFSAQVRSIIGTARKLIKKGF